MSSLEPLGSREVWLGVVVSVDAARAIGRVSGASDDRLGFGTFPFALAAWRADGQPQVGQSVWFVVDPTTRQVLEVDAVTLP
jgi:hypothetical protein